MQEKVSIIVPIYNVEAYLRRCIDSLVKQSYRNIEILLVDDCSEDNSAEIAKEYAEKYPERCYFIQREKNGGLSAARNTGISVAHGKWLTFVDSDDWVTENYVSAMYDMAIKDDADIVSCSRFYMAYSTGKVEDIHLTVDITTGSSHKDKVAHLRFFACSRLIRKEFYINSKINFPEEIRRCEDISTIVPLYTMTEKISIMPIPVYYYFQRKTSLSNQNHRNMDIGFYPKTIARMWKLSQKGFEKELEFRSISELMYGMIMIMVRSGYSRKELKKRVEWFERKFPEWRKNSYIEFLPKGKQIFIKIVSRKQFMIIKILILMWDMKRRI